jgi:hypothetical protein
MHAHVVDTIAKCQIEPRHPCVPSRFPHGTPIRDSVSCGKLCCPGQQAFDAQIGMVGIGNLARQ